MAGELVDVTVQELAAQEAGVGVGDAEAARGGPCGEPFGAVGRPLPDALAPLVVH